MSLWKVEILKQLKLFWDSPFQRDLSTLRQMINCTDEIGFWILYNFLDNKSIGHEYLDYTDVLELLLQSAEYWMVLNDENVWMFIKIFEEYDYLDQLIEKYPIQSILLKKHYRCVRDGCIGMAYNGHIDCLKRINPLQWDRNVAVYAVQNNQIDCLKFLFESEYYF